MNLRYLMRLAVFVTIALITAEASLLLRHSLLRPRLEESCFTSRPEERPLMYPVFKVFGQFKDMLVRMVNVLAAHAKEARLT
ncbi:unnamed protein product [Plutella xylostella]|uniref:(diamondback moth) hypothetical protein n=1 Tax=Plutella xylostella TaxID=51655 RepID=A0A8S4DQ99_PLUXY|nr:unnamed protein product [Plutella xylostella]